MTTDEHNKTLGILQLVYGGLHSLLLVLAVVFTIPVIYTLINEPGRSAPPFGFFLLAIGVGALVSLLFILPSLVAGYGLLKRKTWARKAGIVAAILMALNIPFGTALAAYSFWFLSGRGAQLYVDESARFARYALGDAPPPPISDWVENDRRGEREQVYAPPAQPPDWR
ncbi:MAG: hypothetical protein LC785_18405 [Acidobacteria bacterium]|nr:hypothetical protein [Acidobacteriota bacterium]MCA1643857.1 hypothetical protein [Acidobacteriota bacterium]